MKEEERVIITICDDEGNIGEFEIVDCHENEKGIYGDTAERCLDVLEACEGKLRAVFDPADAEHSLRALRIGKLFAHFFTDAIALFGYTYNSIVKISKLFFCLFIHMNKTDTYEKCQKNILMNYV